MPPEISTYYSHGKLLLTGEYFVLSGAKALAMPVRYGQWLMVRKTLSHTPKLTWNARESGEIWFRATFSTPGFEIEETSDPITALRLQKVLLAARNLNPKFPGETESSVDTDLNFNRHWGLGTSSSLIANIALWTGVDPYALHWQVSEGSAYDIACTSASSALVYSLSSHQPHIEPVVYHPPFRSHLWFVYLGKKEDTAPNIASFPKYNTLVQNNIHRISQMTYEFLNAKTLDQTMEIIRQHEKLLSTVLNRPTLQDMQFADFQGTVKSLGAWGGDFMLAASPAEPNHINRYFHSKGFRVVIPFDEIVIAPS